MTTHALRYSNYIHVLIDDGDFTPTSLTKTLTEPPFKPVIKYSTGAVSKNSESLFIGVTFSDDSYYIAYINKQDHALYSHLPEGIDEFIGVLYDTLQHLGPENFDEEKFPLIKKLNLIGQTISRYPHLKTEGALS